MCDAEVCHRMLEATDHCPNLKGLFFSASASGRGQPGFSLHVLAPLKILHFHCYLRAGDLLPTKFLTQLEELSFLLGPCSTSHPDHTSPQQRHSQIAQVVFLARLQHLVHTASEHSHQELLQVMFIRTPYLQKFEDDSKSKINVELFDTS